MKKKKMIFVVLVYKNYDDFLDFYKSIKLAHRDFKVIIVNSFFNDKTKIYGENIAKETNSDFINVENKGYGYGNNIGIEFALKNYEFDFLVISNPDIEVIKLNTELISKEGITGPIIKNKKNQNQNPHYYKKNRLPFYFMKRYAVLEKNIYLKLYLITNKIFRKLNYIEYKFKMNKQVFALHGSFFIFPYNVLQKMNPLFDENIFLYTEENHVGELASSIGIDMIYNTKLEVFHKEDGSSEGVDMGKHTLDSLKIYFKNWSN
jgi:GT2 family glycosyltransferase